jgi:hypothetical protein
LAEVKADTRRPTISRACLRFIMTSEVTRVRQRRAIGQAGAQ